MIYLSVNFTNMYYYLSLNNKDYSVIQLTVIIQLGANLHGSAERTKQFRSALHFLTPAMYTVSNFPLQATFN